MTNQRCFYATAFVAALVLLTFSAFRVTARADTPPTASGPDTGWAVGAQGHIVRDAVFSVSGRITMEDGTPVADVTVASGPNGVTTTDSDGHYTLHDLGEGTASIVPSRPGYVFTPAARSVSLPPDQTGQDFVAAPASSVWLPDMPQAAPHKPIPGPWVTAPSPTGANLRAIALPSADEGWAVGDFGEILRLSGGAWTSVSSPTRTNLNAVAFSAPGDGWAVGDGGLIVRLKGGAFEAASPTSSSLYAIALSGPDEGWAAGDGTASNYLWDDADTILRLHHGTWSAISLPAAREKRPEPPITRWLELRSLALTGPNDGWAVGFDASSSYPGVFGHGARLQNGIWSIESTLRTYNRLNAIVLSDPTNGWVVGRGGVILRLRDGAWETAGSPTTADLNAIALSGPEDGWAVGAGGTILRLAHGQWYQTTSPTHSALYGVALTGPASGWIVGENGTILAAR
ncbi:MAG: carboxypeptidase regulatory-like domain-containing protein [Anaerolineae bacterium]